MRDEGKFEHEASSGPQHAGKFGKQCSRILGNRGEVLEDLRANNEIEGLRGKGKRSDIALHKVGFPGAGYRFDSPSHPIEHVYTQVQRNDIPAAPRKQDRVPARPTTSIENPFGAVRINPSRGGLQLASVVIREPGRVHVYHVVVDRRN